jgi:hypothetical protein
MRRRGFTLAETTVAMGIMMLLGGAMVAGYAAGLRFFVRTATQGQASQQAALAVKYMAAEVQQAMAIKQGAALPADECSTNTQLVFVAPTKDATTGFNLVPLQEGTWVRYYLADKRGTYGNNGRYLWRASRAAGESTWRTDRCLGPSVTSAYFAYLPDIQNVSRVSISVTVTPDQGGGSAAASESTEALLRNLQK